MYTAELRAKMKKLLAPEGLSHSELLGGCKQRELPVPVSSKGAFTCMSSRLSGCETAVLAHVTPQPCNEITLNSFIFQ